MRRVHRQSAAGSSAPPGEQEDEDRGAGGKPNGCKEEQIDPSAIEGGNTVPRSPNRPRQLAGSEVDAEDVGCKPSVRGQDGDQIGMLEHAVGERDGAKVEAS